MSNWQRIETAEKDDGVRVLLWNDDDPHEEEPMVIGLWDEDAGAWTDVEGYSVKPTHWMPLPEPPKNEQLPR